MATKKYHLSIVLLAVLALSIVQLPPVYAVDSPADTKQVLIFLRDVVGLDMEKYETTLTTCFTRDYTNDANPIGNLGYIETSGQYTLHYWDTAKETYSALEVTFSFANATLRTCGLNILAGVPYTSKPLSSNLLEAAGTFLERYEAFTGDVELSAMQNMLTTVDATKNSTKIAGNLKLEVSATYNRTSLQWIQSQNGVDYNSLTIDFDNGSFLNFFDSRSYRTVGSSEINISKEQAIDLALKEANGFSYTYNGKLVDNLTIVEDQIRAELRANVRDKPTLFYPCWIVDLPLDAVYPGLIYYIEVLIWADSGQVISCKTMGYGGPLPNDSTINPSPEASTIPEDSASTTNQNQNSPLFPFIAYIAVALAAVLIPTLIVAVVLKKKRSK